MTPLLDVSHVSRAFGGTRVNNDVTFALGPGERVALIGPNGAGKTTLVNVVTGQLAPSQGRIALGGEDVTRLSIAARVRKGLVRNFQITRVFAGLTVAENVALAVLQKRGLAWRLFASASPPAVREERDRILDMLGIADLAHLPVPELAYGQQRLLDLAIALALDPKVLILDEPAAGVPHEESQKILDAIDRLPREIAVLLIEHDMDLVFRFAERVLVLAAGELIFQGAAADVARDETVRRAYLGSYADAGRRA